MDNSEKMAKAQELIKEANQLLDEISFSKNESANSSPTAEYEDALRKPTPHYYIGLRGKVVEGTSFPKSFEKHCDNPYWRFLSFDYARIAAIHHRLIDAQLAFKWCHDRDYVPDWKNSDENKYAVYFNYVSNKYYVLAEQSCCDVTMVYFSAYEIAQKCADWLNALNKEE